MPKKTPKPKKPSGKTVQIKKRVFLEAVGQVGNITHAAQLAKISRNNHYDWLKDDPDKEYEKLYNSKMLEACDRLETEARKRAIEGFEEVLYKNGKKVGKIRRRPSDLLLIFLLKGANPDKYKDRFFVEGKQKIEDIDQLANIFGVISKLDVLPERNGNSRIPLESNGNGNGNGH